MIKMEKALRYEITDKCNLRCKMCWSTLWKHEDMQLEKVELLLSEYNELYPKQIVVFTSREPLASNHFYDALKFSVDRGLNNSILTNGILLTERAADFIIHQNVELINMSLYGNCDYHDYIVGLSGSALKTIASLELLNSKKIHFNSNKPHLRITTINNSNLLQSFEYIAKTASRVSASIRIQHLMWHSKKQKELHKSVLYNEFKIEDSIIDSFLCEPSVTGKTAMAIIKKAKKICQDLGVELQVYPELSIEEIENWYNDEPIVFKKAKCDHIGSSIRVRANGEVVTCQYIDYIYGKIGQKSLKEILEDPMQKDIIHRLENGNLLPLCHRCCHVASENECKQLNTYSI